MLPRVLPVTSLAAVLLVLGDAPAVAQEEPTHHQLQASCP